MQLKGLPMRQVYFAKRHYDLLSSALKESRPPDLCNNVLLAQWHNALLAQWYKDIDIICSKLMIDNPKFKPDQFKTDCGIT